MHGANDPSSLQRAHALLAAQQSRRSAPDFRSELLSTALACHGRMLALGDSDPRAAADLALAGADLLQTFQQLEGSAATAPDWVLIHEEQCCRYGARWIHGLLQTGHRLDQDSDYARRAIALLERLQQLHPEPVAWIAPMQQELESFSPARTAADLRVVVVGNCQAHPLMLGLRQALPQARIHATPSVHLATPDDVAALHRRLPAADLLVMHRVQPGYRDDIGLDAVTLSRRLPPTARRMVLPNLHYEGHHPWIAYAHDPDGRLADLETSSPLGPYHDFLAMVAVGMGRHPTHLLCQPCTATLCARLREAHQLSLAELSRRETDCDVSISDWIHAEHRRRPLVHTINHPTQALIHELLRRLLQELGRPEAWPPDPLDQHEHLGSLSIPIHPWVREALQLEQWSATWGTRDGHPWGIADQLQASMAFYQRHPWILEANAKHPKARFVAELLTALDSPPPLTNRRAPSPGPGMPAPAGPIPYAFLDPLHDFSCDEQQLSAATASLPAWNGPLHTYRIGWRVEPDACVLPVGVISRQGWLSDCLQYLPPQWPHADWLSNIAGYHLAHEGKTVQLVDHRPTPPTELAGRWCVLNDIVAHRNLGHFFQDLLPQLMAIRRLRRQWPDLQILGSPERHPNLRLLRELVLGEGWQPRPPDERLRVAELFLQPLAFNGGVGFLARPDPHWWLAIDDLRDGLQLLRRRLAPEPGAVWHRHWLCFCRDLGATTEAPQGRRFSNHPQLLEQLSRAGVLLLDPGLHDIRQLQLLVAGARGFVGIHGAGLYNALLGQPGARLVEIQPACGCWRSVEMMALSAGLDWHAVICQRDPDNPEQSLIPIDAVLALLS